MSKQNSISEVFDAVRYQFNDNYGLVFINYDTYQYISTQLSNRRRLGEIDSHTYHILLSLANHQFRNLNRIAELDAQQPRKIAQQFIGRKKIRKFIFDRDKKCLKCGSEDNLQIDHIISINSGGENRLSNLQTLCKRCNVIKSINFKDYRNGAR